MPRDTRIADVLRAEGCTVNEVDGWKTRGADAFAPVGVIVHHTAGSARGDAPSLNVCINGRSDLPGPLCHVLLARSGVCHVVAAGRANHAGTGSWRGATGNSKFFGIEAENTGIGEPWPAVQLDVFVRATAALLRLTGNGAEWCAAHREFAPRRKIDPTGIDLDDFRRKVAARLASNAAPSGEDVFTMAALDRLDGQKALVRQLFRTYLCRNPNDQTELDVHVLALARDGYENRVVAFSESAEGVAVLAAERIAAGLR